jgi:hypothetical protein
MQLKKYHISNKGFKYYQDFNRKDHPRSLFSNKGQVIFDRPPNRLVGVMWLEEALAPGDGDLLLALRDDVAVLA